MSYERLKTDEFILHAESTMPFDELKSAIKNITGVNHIEENRDDEDDIPLSYFVISNYDYYRHGPTEGYKNIICQ